MSKVIITSKNPVKVNSVKIAFKEVYPEKAFKFECISVSSDVSDQPMSDKETLQGAKNRIKNARKIDKHADFYVGLEGGVEIDAEGNLRLLGWVVIQDKSKKEGSSNYGNFILPNIVKDCINAGQELGDAMDTISNDHNSKQKDGAIGYFTKGMISRTSIFKNGVVLALVPFLHPELY